MLAKSQFISDKLQLQTSLIWLGIVDGLEYLLADEEMIKAKLFAAEAGVAALRYYNANGRLPVSLDALLPDYLDMVPTDPFTGKPLLYRQTDDGVMIYSVGGNGIDDGGRPRLLTPEEGPDSDYWKRPYDDRGFRLVLPEKEGATQGEGE